MICLALTGERVDQLGLAQQSETNTDEYRTAFTVSIDAVAALRRDDGHQRAGSRDDDSRRRRSGDGAGRSPPRRPRLPAARARGRRAAARRPHRSGGRSRAPGRTAAGRRDLRDPQRGRHDGAAAAARGVRAGARLTFITVAQLVAHRLKTERLVHRVAEARLPTEHGDVARSSATRTTSTSTSTSRSSSATSATARTCSSACTRSASPATSSTRCAATAAGSSTPRWR